MKIPLEIEIRVSDLKLSAEDRRLLREWIEDAIFAKFGRSPCHGWRNPDGSTTYNYKVDWVTE